MQQSHWVPGHHLAHQTRCQVASASVPYCLAFLADHWAQTDLAASLAQPANQGDDAISATLSMSAERAGKQEDDDATWNNDTHKNMDKAL